MVATQLYFAPSWGYEVLSGVLFFPQAKNKSSFFAPIIYSY